MNIFPVFIVLYQCTVFDTVAVSLLNYSTQWYTGHHTVDSQIYMNKWIKVQSETSRISLSGEWESVNIPWNIHGN